MQFEEKRKGKQPIPDDVMGYLNNAQLHTYHLLQNFGWSIKFIRRAMFQRIVCVVTNQQNTTLAVIEDDGFLNRQPDIPLRSAKNQADNNFNR